MNKAWIAISLAPALVLVGCKSKPEPAAQVPPPNYAAQPEPLPPVSINEGSTLSTPRTTAGDGYGSVSTYDPEPLPDASPAHRTYIIRKGDTFYGIARREYGDAKRWRDIAQLNPSLDPKRLKIGSEIVLP